ncbi:uncharacterized protein LOC106770388 [Vigna radiata var. radiata]|uniref:Uncharacterized protein LOC106770388 n=1 Tax=Vigna radiata var. radiata TaxID=3916 RepID=A0A1S3V015_VIGRR|nr:uncharacterized protein LOC106770388 [Vigna radiata var. radiata]
MEIFKKLEITIPFSEALQQMSSYAKFLKELLMKKRKYIEKETIEVQGNCSAIIQEMLPPKLQDLGSFTIPCTIGELEVGKALIDLVASINLMPFSMFKRIEGLELRPIRMTLQLADRSLKYPYEVVEDVLVKVDKFLFPVDFVIMEMEENVDAPLILGRPFMKTTRILIDVENGKLKVRVQDEEVDFDVFQAISYPKDDKACFQVDSVDELCMMQGSKMCGASPLERTLINEREHLNEEEEKLIEECLRDLETSEEIPTGEESFEKIEPKEEVNKTKFELKALPPHLKYVFLEEDGGKPIIISKSLSPEEEEKLVGVLKEIKVLLGGQSQILKV